MGNAGDTLELVEPPGQAAGFPPPRDGAATAAELAGPRGPGRLTLSRMNMGGVGTAMIKGVMARRNVPSLDELIASARASGVRLVACRMSMDTWACGQKS